MDILKRPARFIKQEKLRGRHIAVRDMYYAWRIPVSVFSFRLVSPLHLVSPRFNRRESINSKNTVFLWHRLLLSRAVSKPPMYVCEQIALKHSAAIIPFFISHFPLWHSFSNRHKRERRLIDKDNSESGFMKWIHLVNDNQFLWELVSVFILIYGRILFMQRGPLHKNKLPSCKTTALCTNRTTSLESLLINISLPWRN